MFSVLPGFESYEGTSPYKDWTLLVGVPSVGHVGQLTADLILQNGGMQKAARIFHPGVEPMVGHSPKQGSSPSTLVTSAELYVGDKVALLHLRAPVMKKKSGEFVEYLLDFVDKHEFRQVVLISGVFASERVDSQLEAHEGIESFRYFATSDVSPDLLKDITTVGWKLIEKRQFPDASSSSEEGILHIPGSSFTKSFLEESEKRKSKKPTVAFLMFASDGMPIGQVVSFYSAINAALKLKTGEGTSVQIPPEWDDAAVGINGGGSSDSLKLIY